MPIIEKLDTLARTRTTDESLAIIDGDDRVHMATWTSTSPTRRTALPICTPKS